MKLTALRLHNVRRFGGRGVRIENIGEGVNVLCAANEYGKSTSFDALHALFFQAHTGTPSAVQALRPYSGGSPLVEADLLTADGAFRLTKQFYSGRRAQVRERDSGRLIAQADEAERFMSNLVRGGTGGPAGLLWVRQGTTGIEKRAKSDDETERRARETVLTSVQGEVEALTGGRRMSHALAACEAELTRLVTTTGKAKTGGPYAVALEEQQRLRELEARLGGEVVELRAALDHRRSVRGRLAEIDTPEQERDRHAALADGEAILALAKAHRSELDAARSGEALARNELEAARFALSTFQQSRARHNELVDLLMAAEADRDAHRTQHHEAKSAATQASANVIAAEQNEREQRDYVAALEKSVRATSAASRLALVRKARDDADAARKDVEVIQASIKNLTLPPKKLAELGEIEEHLAGQRAAERAQAPLLRVEYSTGVDAAVSIDSAILQHGEERPLLGTTLIDIVNVGRLSLSVPRSEKTERDIVALKARQSALLAEMGIESLAAGRQREAQLRDLSNQLALARQRFDLLAPTGLGALDEEIVRLEAEVADSSQVTGDLGVARAAAREAEALMRSTREAATAARARAELLATSMVEAERRVAALASSLAAIRETLGATVEWSEREEDLKRAEKEASAKFQRIAEHAAEMAARNSDLPAAEARYARMRSLVEAARSEIVRLREEAAGLNGRIQTRAESAIEEAWQEARDKLSEADRKVAVLSREVAILTRLRSALEGARSEARYHYFAPVLQELRPLLGLLFDAADVTFDEDTLLPRAVERNGLEEEVGFLSGGMREQLAILTRLAFARLLAKDGQITPVILDDALVYSDDDRIEKMFDALHRQAQSQQIVVFSCRQRAFARLGGNVLHTVPWDPVAAS
ncbi:AAA family ATPase [Bosea sp. TAF32]|uniref:AAA family ATPase n=1 Tax=Bosea sp. TAF32 TaxID=3237482 RepID=UPI003F90AB2A